MSDTNLAQALREIIAVTSATPSMTEQQLGIAMGRIQEICERSISIQSGQQADDWRQYATEREETAQQVIERHRAEHESLLKLLAQARTELGRSYRCIQGMHNTLTRGISFSAEAYHAPTIGAAKRFVFEGSLDGSDYFIGKPVDVLHAALALPKT